MKINSLKNKSSLNFTSIPLYKATLFQNRFLKQARPIEAVVSQFEKSDFGREALEDGKWCFTSFGEEILCAIKEKMHHPYKNPCHFLLAEVPSFPEKNKVAAMASYFMGEKSLVLRVLQSKSEFSLVERVKGAGSILMYALSKIAQENNLQEISLRSAGGARKFYKKLGMEEFALKEFVLPKIKFGEFQRKLEEKYLITKA